MGLRTHRCGPTTTTCRGASHGPGVPPPTAAKFQVHHAYRAIPAAMTTTASHATGVGVRPSRVRICQGTQTPPRPGTATVNSRLRTTRLSVRTIVARAPSLCPARLPGCAGGSRSVRHLDGPALYIAFLHIATLPLGWPSRKAWSSIATYEGRGAEGSPGRDAARDAGRRPAARLRGDRGAAEIGRAHV